MTKATRFPDVGEFVRGVGTLFETIAVPPPPQPPPTTVFVFEVMTAQMRIRVGGKIINTGSTFNDFYGKRTCVEEALKEAESFVRRRNIGPQSDVEVIVVQAITKTNQVLDRREAKNFYDGTFPCFKSYEGYLDCGNSVETIVWSSRDEKENPCH